VAPVQYLVSGCTPGSDRSQGCKSRCPDDHNDVRKASNTPLILFSETRRKQPSKTEKRSIVTPFSVPSRIPEVVIVCPKREETALSPFLRSKRVTDGRKCPKNGTQKPDHLIRTGSYDPVGGIDTRGVVSCVALGLPRHPPKGAVPRYPPRGVLRDWSRPVPGSCRGVVSPLTGGFPHKRALGVTAETGASRVPPPSLIGALIEPSPTAFGARGVSGGGASGGGEVVTLHTPSQSLSGTRGSTQGPDASFPASMPPVGGASRVGGAGAAAAVSVPMGGPLGADRAPAFSKNERARLADILCTPDVAAGVITSRAGMSRQPQDPRQSRRAVWVVVVAPVLNESDLFDVPVECADGGIDPNAHPNHRTGKTLKAKWSEVCRWLPIRSV